MEKKLFASHGLKATKSRDAVLDVLKAANTPITAEEVYLKLQKKGFNLSTIYRTLNSFANSGLAKKEVNQNKENIYSLNNDEDSHVLVCIKCHKRVPLEGCPYHEVNEAIEQKTGFEVLDHHTEIYGVCPNCQNKK